MVSEPQRPTDEQPMNVDDDDRSPPPKMEVDESLIGRTIIGSGAPERERPPRS